MIRLKVENEYWGKKKALWAALRYFAEKKDIPTILISLATPEKINNYRFCRNKLEAQIGYSLYGSMSQIIKESLPKSKTTPEGALYHKKNILKIFNESLYEKN